MIVAHTTGLVVEHGRQVTTRQIAEAAGIGEGTIFRVFSDKEELLAECLLEAMRMSEATAQVEALPLEGTLQQRLTWAATVLEEHIGRAGAIAAALGGTWSPTPERESDREAAFAAARQALVRLMEPERELLRHAPEQVAVLLIGLLFERLAGPVGAADLSTGELVSIVLHGILTPQTRNGR